MSEYLFGWVSGALETLFDIIKDFFVYLGTSIWNAIIWVVDQIIGIVEWLINSFRSWLPYAIMVTLMWFGATHAFKDSQLGIEQKAIRTLGSILLAPIVAMVFDALVPSSFVLPRISASPKEISISESHYHEQYTYEDVTIS